MTTWPERCREYSSISGSWASETPSSSEILSSKKHSFVFYHSFLSSQRTFWFKEMISDQFPSSSWKVWQIVKIATNSFLPCICVPSTGGVYFPTTWNCLGHVAYFVPQKFEKNLQSRLCLLPSLGTLHCQYVSQSTLARWIMRCYEAENWDTLASGPAAPADSQSNTN